MLRHFLNLFLAYVNANKKLFLGGLLLGLLAANLVYYLKPRLENMPSRKIIGMAGNYTLATLPLSIQKQLSYGMTAIGPDQTATGAAASSWTSTDSGKTFYFTLDNRLKWQDGKLLTSYDINYNLADVNIERPDSTHINFLLPDSFAPLPSVLSQPLFRTGLIGLGEYKLKNYKNIGRFLQSILIGNNHQEILYKFYPTKKAVLLALKLGEIQEVEGMIDPRGKPNYQEQAIVVLNLKVNGLADKSFRQGLAYALPTDFPLGERSNGPIAPTSWAYNPNLKKYYFDLEQAKKLLNADNASKSASLILATNEELKSVAYDIAANWEKAGVKTSIEVSEVIPKNFQAYLTFIDLPPDPDQYQLWHSTLTAFGYKSPKVDKLLEEGRRTIDPEIRRGKYLDFQKAITEDLPALFLFFPKIYSLTRQG